MILSERQLDKFKEIYQQYTDEELSDKEALRKALILFYMLEPLWSDIISELQVEAAE